MIDTLLQGSVFFLETISYGVLKSNILSPSQLQNQSIDPWHILQPSCYGYSIFSKILIFLWSILQSYGVIMLVQFL